MFAKQNSHSATNVKIIVTANYFQMWMLYHWIDSLFKDLFEYIVNRFLIQSFEKRFCMTVGHLQLFARSINVCDEATTVKSNYWIEKEKFFLQIQTMHSLVGICIWIKIDARMEIAMQRKRDKSKSETNKTTFNNNGNGNECTKYRMRHCIENFAQRNWTKATAMETVIITTATATDCIDLTGNHRKVNVLKVKVFLLL